MRQSFIKKVALFMCTVMIFCAIPLNGAAVGSDVSVKAQTSTESGSASAGETNQQEQQVLYAFKQVLAAVKKVVIAINDYLEEQERLEQEQTTPVVKPADKEDTEKENGLSESGIAGYLYDAKEKCFYTASDPWQRIVGYNELFDIFSEIAFIDFDTIRFKFDYKKENWMIQIWKGQYGLLFYGAEIGVYKKPADRKIAHYDAVGDSERLKMSMDFYEYEKKLFTKAEWNKKFSRPYGYYWWCTGYIPGNRNDEFDKLRVDARITAKDYDMLSGITRSMEKQGIDYKIKGLDIIFTYQ